uniref:Uncharacterized protein n=1 Tax=Rhizophora mucronata TaxID=61149 RepID=A0A2P2QN26_RHIMU
MCVCVSKQITIQIHSYSTCKVALHTFDYGSEQQ